MITGLAAGPTVPEDGTLGRVLGDGKTEALPGSWIHLPARLPHTVQGLTGPAGGPDRSRKRHDQHMHHRFPGGATGAARASGRRSGVPHLWRYMMFEAGDIREWRGHDVVDPDGHKIGTLESVYVDTATDDPSFATVTVGLPTRRRLVFVPLDRATVGPGYLRVAHDRNLVKRAPSIDTDGVLPATDEPEVFAHYELEYMPGLKGERRLARR